MRLLQKIKEGSMNSRLEIYEYLAWMNGTSLVSQKNIALRQIIKICYCNKSNQFYLCNNLEVPFSQGPICLTPVPVGWNGKEGQLLNLFRYLRKVKEFYICWMIYEDSDLGVLNLKLITSYELDELTEELEFGQCLIGIFIGGKYSKGRALSTKINQLNYTSVSNGLRCKASKENLEGLYEKLNKKSKILRIRSENVLRNMLKIQKWMKVERNLLR